MFPNNTSDKGLVPDLLDEGLYRPQNEVTSEVELENYEETDKENISSRKNVRKS